MPKSFGQIFAKETPFHGKSDDVIKAVVLRGQHPSRPDTTLLNEGMWKIMKDCWQHRRPTKRPAASEVVTRVAGLRSFKTEFRPAPDRNASDPSQISEDVKHPVLDTEGLDRLWEDLEPLARTYGVTRTAVNTPVSSGTVLNRTPSPISPDGAVTLSYVESAEGGFGPFDGSDAIVSAHAFKATSQKPHFAGQPVEEGESSENEAKSELMSRELAEEGRAV
ncbi:hypothetical protein L218DRAFT_1008621 [Marasmius fiardii PR-910]|nr:hypothetical protein L218DRAFT_1008621 [Marasmius fiardii PR-910]